MAHYAELNDENIVTNVFVGRDENDLLEGITDWEEYYSQVLGCVVKRTSYNTVGNVHYSGEFDADGEKIPSEDQSKALRANYAGKGYIYDSEADVFYAPEPRELLDMGSWVLNTETYLWDFISDTPFPDSEPV